MSWMTIYGPCLLCRRPFSYNPNHVPSHPWPPPDGPRQPLCPDCITYLNAVRVERGEHPWPIHPQAYEPEEVA